MDKQALGYLDFKQLVFSLGIVSSNRITEKLKLLYILHLPPLLSRSEIEKNRQKSTRTDKPEKGADEEVGTEAEDFFRLFAGKLKATISDLKSLTLTAKTYQSH